MVGGKCYRGISRLGYLVLRILGGLLIVIDVEHV
jgi:hypothetical protein